MATHNIPEQKRQAILDLAATRGATNVRVFGSAARETSVDPNDLDLLVDMEQGRSLLDLVGLWQDLEEMLHCPVDLVTEEGLSPYMRDRILSEAVPL